ncbi:unnamed protein product [Sphagnum jensenii]|uniref:Uncharacterized protein n=2 Tax=Sphagnum jensenii TaxID=128206 RepID=A0ABP0WEV8_9BRYO
MHAKLATKYCLAFRYRKLKNHGAPCGACKFLRRKCVRGCIFAPYFGADQGAARFAAVHKIFGASNVAKLLQHIPMPRRCDAVLTISYEAQARLSDPVYGCVATIFALQQQVASLQAELAMVQAQLADRHAAAAAHLQQQQHPQMGAGLSSSAAAGQAAYMQQFEQQSDQLNIPPTSALSMSLATLSHQALVQQAESLEKPRTGTLSDQPDDGELQALAHSLLRRSK